jgi:hypothetical protein
MQQLTLAFLAPLTLVTACQPTSHSRGEDERSSEALPTTQAPATSPVAPASLISVTALAVVPERYDGQRVRTLGFVMYSDLPEEGGFLEPSKEAAHLGLFQGIAVTAGSCVPGTPKDVSPESVESLLAAQAVSGYVELEGTFRARGVSGHGIVRPTLCNITRATAKHVAPPEEMHP